VREKNDLEDSFKRYFDKKNRQLEQTTQSLDDIFEEKQMDQQDPRKEKQKENTRNIYRISGTLTPDQRPRVISVDLNVKEALTLSRQEGVTLTLYMTALYLLSIYEAKPNKDKATTISVSIPINLREFFPSVSVRNFFSTTLVTYTFNAGETHHISDICQELNRQFQQQLDKKSLEKRLQRYIEFERNPLARILPRFLKDFVLKGANSYNNRHITVAMSNLGIAKLPSEAEQFIDKITFYTSVVRPQFCMISYKDNLNITFTTPFTETDIHKFFVRHLTAKGLDVVVDANKVTAKELEEK
jgi:3-isopropylmalate dehydratase small subunit